jgi:hypothetical protein
MNRITSFLHGGRMKTWKELVLVITFYSMMAASITTCLGSGPQQDELYLGYVTVLLCLSVIPLVTIRHSKGNPPLPVIGALALAWGNYHSVLGRPLGKFLGVILSSNILATTLHHFILGWLTALLAFIAVQLFTPPPPPAPATT